MDKTEELETWEVELDEPSAYVVVLIKKGATEDEILDAAISELTANTYIWSKKKRAE